MKKTYISELKSRLTAYLRSVRGGGGQDDRLARLVRSGVLTPPRAPMTMSLLRRDVVRAKRSVLVALLEERAEGR